MARSAFRAFVIDTGIHAAVCVPVIALWFTVEIEEAPFTPLRELLLLLFFIGPIYLFAFGTYSGALAANALATHHRRRTILCVAGTSLLVRALAVSFAFHVVGHGIGTLGV